jgi:N-acetyltransferase 10
LGQAELVVIDEAAAIPLPLVKKLLGPYLVFMASTINGYEGTGRSLSLKLIQQLREQSRGFVGRAEGPLKDAGGEDIVVGRDLKSKKDTATSDVNGAAVGGRSLREIKLEEPIRYALNDPVEKWLNKLLCLDATIVSKNIQGCPHPSECELFYVNRDTLFSYHPVSETFLQRMMALYVASHYKNSPNDLQLMSDAPAHHLFVLLPPIREGDASLPDPLVVVQVCLEGEISKQSVMNSLSRGQRAGGDLIPWLISQQFQDDDFAALSGARVVRIATHPDYAKMGYGARALDQLKSFYQGEITSLDENAMDEDSEQVHRVDDDELEEANLLTDDVRIRDPRKMPPLLMRLSEKKPVRLHYLGVSYGLTQQLHRFWKKSGFVPLYLRQTANELTGEHTCVMLNTLNSQDVGQDDWLDAFARDFKKRFINLLSYQFNVFPSVTALSILEAASRDLNHTLTTCWIIMSSLICFQLSANCCSRAKWPTMSNYPVFKTRSCLPSDCSERVSMTLKRNSTYPAAKSWPYSSKLFAKSALTLNKLNREPSKKLLPFQLSASMMMKTKKKKPGPMASVILKMLMLGGQSKRTWMKIWRKRANKQLLG